MNNVVTRMVVLINFMIATIVKGKNYRCGIYS
jgi:hypothetical protein